MSLAGIFMTENDNWSIISANERLAELFQSDIDRLNELDFFDFIPPDDIEQVKATLKLLAAGEIEKFTEEQLFLRRNGSNFWGNLSIQRLTKKDGSLQGLIYSIYDVTERRESEEQLNRIESNYWEIFNSTNDAIFVHDAYTGAIVDANKTVEKMYGYTREEIFFMNVHDLSAGVPPYSLNEAVNQIRKAVEGGPQTYEWLGKKKNNELFWTEITLTASQIGGEGRVLAVIRDIGDRKEIEKRLKYLSAHDSLTGLYNRAHFETEFERISKGRKYPISIIVSDLDGLKMINDTHGHAAGDQLIKNAAELLNMVFRQEDLVARFGGDEFIVLLPEADEIIASHLMDRIRAAAKRMETEPGLPRIHFSLGCATANSKNEMADLFNLADSRMYEDKAAGKLRRAAPNC